MADDNGPLAAERRFFDALIASDVAELEDVLADDFLLIDVMSGSEIPRAAMLDVLRSGQLRFLSIEPAEARVRRYGQTAVITGRTEMKMSFDGNAIESRSRYTHVFVEEDGRWRMVSAQGTQIAPAPDGPAPE